MINLDKSIDSQHLTIESNHIESTFRVLHLSDVHIPRPDVPLTLIVKTIARLHPDVIFVTGDLFDCRATPKDVDVINSFLLQLNSIGKLLWVRGNHELKNRYSKEILDKLVIQPLMNEYIQVRDDIEVLGVDETARYVRSQNKSGRLTLVLSHHPESYSYHLTGPHCFQFSGHVHGGQVRVGNQGLFGPDQGVLLKYSKGYYPMGNQSGLIVCAGLGRSIFPMRINNPSHIVVVDFIPVGYNRKVRLVYE